MTFDLFTSLDDGTKSVERTRYQTIITNVRWAARDNFSLLKWCKSQEPAPPFLVTVPPYKSELAYIALKQGALDFIRNPPKQERVVRTLKAAQWVYQFRATIAYRKKTLDTFRARYASLMSDTPEQVVPQNREILGRAVNSCERTIDNCERTIAAIERSLRHLNSTLGDLEHTTRAQALERLNGLP